MLTPPSVEPPNRVIPGIGLRVTERANGLSGTFGFVTAKAASARESFNPTSRRLTGQSTRPAVVRKTS